MLKIWYGDEPYLIRALKAREEAAIEDPELNIVDNGDELTEETFNECYQDTLFGSRRYLVFRAADLKNPYVAKLIADEPTNEVRIIVSKFEPNLKVAKSLKKEQVQEFKRLSEKDMPSFVKFFLARFRANIREEDFNYLVRRINYSNRTSADLYTVRHWLEALFSLEVVTKEDIDFVIPPEENTNAFSLFKHLCDGQPDKYFDLAERLLLTEDAIGLLSLLLSNFRISYKASIAEGKPEEAVGVPKFRISDIKAEVCTKCMTLLQDGVNAIKNGEGSREVFIRVSAELFSILKKSA